jgi:putative NADH-flavin reductase
MITGASGYVGGRLLHRLETASRPLRCLTRRPDVLRDRVGPHTEVVEGDVLDRASLHTAFQGVHTAFETVRALVERLPVIVAPPWVETLAQPIAIEEVIDYLHHRVFGRMLRGIQRAAPGAETQTL